MNKVILMGRLTKNPEIKYAGKDNNMDSCQIYHWQSTADLRKTVSRKGRLHFLRSLWEEC